MSPQIRVRRIYEPVTEDDGLRVLVDRLWPRGVRKEGAGLDAWMRELAPSDELRRWYGHELDRWPEFVQRYEAELREPARQELLARLENEARQRPVTILTATRDVAHSDAAVVAAMLEDRLRGTRS